LQSAWKYTFMYIYYMSTYIVLLLFLFYPIFSLSYEHEILFGFYYIHYIYLLLWHPTWTCFLSCLLWLPCLFLFCLLALVFDAFKNFSFNKQKAFQINVYLHQCVHSWMNLLNCKEKARRKREFLVREEFFHLIRICIKFLYPC
jgi:hypothetical protein